MKETFGSLLGQERVVTISGGYGARHSRFLSVTKRAEAAGIQAINIDCMGDVGFYAVRELLDIPVVGPAQASMSLAATLADHFSVVGVLERDRATFHNI